MRQIVSVYKTIQNSKILSKITFFSRCEIFKNFFSKFSKFFFLQISPNYASKRGFPKIWKKKFLKKKIFWVMFFFENRYKIAKNQLAFKMLTVLSRQDFGVFETHWFFWIWANASIVNWLKSQVKILKNWFFEKL